MAEWSIDEVGEWLRHLGLDEYIERFKKNHIDGSVLFDITEADLKDEFKMMSVGHRKNFMKAIGNLKKIFCGPSGKNSEYIRQKIHKFYEKNKQKTGKMGLINSLGSDSKFYSHRFYTKNFYSGQDQIIEEDDEHSVKFETNPSPLINAKDDDEHVESIVLSERQEEAGSEDRKNSQPEFESEEDIRHVRQKATSKEDVGSHRDIDHAYSKLVVDTKADKKSDQRGGNKPSSESKGNSPLKRENNSDKQPSNEDTSKSGDNNHQQQQPQFQHQQSKNEKNEKNELNSPESSSESSSESDSSEDEKAPKKPEDKKEDQLVLDVAAPKVVKPEQKKMHKKNTSTNASNFKSAEFTTKAKNPYKEGQKVKKRHRQYKKGDLEDINQKISNTGSNINTKILIEDDIIRKFRESGLNENFIINYNELFFEKKIGEGGKVTLYYQYS